MSVSFDPLAQNSFAGSSSGNYPIDPTLTGAQAESNPFSTGITGPGNYSNIPTASSAFNSQGAAGAIGTATSAATSVGNSISTVAGLFTPSNLTRLLVIVIGVIFLIIGLAMLGKQGVTVNIAGLAKAA